MANIFGDALQKASGAPSTPTPVKTSGNIPPATGGNVFSAALAAQTTKPAVVKKPTIVTPKVSEKEPSFLQRVGTAISNVFGTPRAKPGALIAPLNTLKPEDLKQIQTRFPMATTTIKAPTISAGTKAVPAFNPYEAAQRAALAAGHGPLNAQAALKTPEGAAAALDVHNTVKNVINKSAGEMIANQNNPAEFLKGLVNPVKWEQSWSGLVASLVTEIARNPVKESKPWTTNNRTLRAILGTDTVQPLSDKLRSNQQEFGPILGGAVSILDTVSTAAVPLIAVDAIAGGITRGAATRATRAEAEALSNSARNILGITKDATPAEARAAYLAKAHDVHPDTGGSAAEFHRVQTAYQYLTNPTKALDLNILRTKPAKTTQVPEKLGTGQEPAPLPAAAYGGKLKIERTPSLPYQESIIEKQSAIHAEKNTEALYKEYKTKFGKVLNTDNARELFPAYNASKAARATYSPAVHEPASSLVKNFYARELADNVGKGNGKVLFMSGGTGAGKTTAVEYNVGDHYSKFPIVYDTNMNKLDSAVQKIEQAKDAGYKVVIAHVYRSPVESMVEGSLPRAMRVGRTVPLAEHVNTHLGSDQTIRQLAEHYKGDPDVKILIIDNSHGKGKGRLIPFDQLPKIRYNEYQLRNQLRRELDNEYAKGHITKTIYNATLAKRPATGSERGGTVGAGISRQSQQAGEEAAGVAELSKEAKAVIDDMVRRRDALVELQNENPTDEALARAVDQLNDQINRAVATGDITLHSEFIPGLHKAIQEDIIPKGRGLISGSRNVWDEIRVGLNPVGLAPRKAVDIMLRNRGQVEEYMFRVERAMSKVKAMWDRQPHQAVLKFLTAVEKDLKVDKNFQELADMYRSRGDALYQIVKKYKDINYWENYFAHYWKKPAEVEAFFAKQRHLEGATPFLKQRIFEDYATGIAFGFEPLSWNPEEIMQMAEFNVRRFAMAQEIVKEQISLGTMAYVERGEVAPIDMVKINDKISKTYFEKPKGSQDLYAHKSVARLIENMLSPDLIRESNIGTILMNARNFFNTVQLGLSAFHATFETIDAMVTRFSSGLVKLASGDFKGFLKNIATVPAAPIIHFTRGRAAFREAGLANELHKLTGNYIDDPVLAQLLKDFFTGGGSLRNRQYFRSTVFETFQKNVREGNYPSALVRMPMAIVESSMRPLLSYYVPRLKLGAFEDIMHSELLRRKTDLADGIVTREEIARSVMNNIENRLGELNYDNLFWNRTFKAAMQLSFRSPTWNIGTLREIGGALAEDIPRGLGRTVQFGKGTLGERLKSAYTQKISYTFSLFFLTAVMGGIYMYLHTGRGPKTLKDYYYPENGAKDANGNPVRVEMPTYLKDVYQWTHRPIKTIGNKLAGEATLLIELLNNKDYYGDYIRDPGAMPSVQIMQIATFIIQNVQPFSFQQVRKLSEGTATTEQKIEAFLGVINAPPEIQKEDWQVLLTDLYVAAQRAQGPRTPEQKQVDQLKTKARTELKQGVTTTTEKLIDMGVIKSEQSLRQFIQNAQLTGEERMFKGLSKEDRQKVLDLKNNGAKNESSFIDTVLLYASAIKSDPGTAFDRIFTGENIVKLRNGTIIVQRLPLKHSEYIKSQMAVKQGVLAKDMRQDHTIPLELGGSNHKSNLKLVPEAQWAEYTPAENHLKDLLESGKISKSKAQQLITDYKAGRIPKSDIMNLE